MKSVQELMQEALKILADHDKLMQDIKDITAKHEIAIGLLSESHVLSYKIQETQAEQISFLKEELAKFNSRIPCEDRRCNRIV